MFNDAKREYDISVELKRETYPLVDKTAEIWLAYLKNDKEGVRKVLHEVEKDQDAADLDSLELASFHFFLDDLDGGFDWLNRGYSRKEYALILIQNYLDIPEKVRVDQRYLNFLKKLGLN